MRKGVLIVFDKAGKPKVRLGPEVDYNDQLVELRAMLLEPPKGVVAVELWDNSVVRRQVLTRPDARPVAVSGAAREAADEAARLNAAVEAAANELREARQVAATTEPDAAVMGRISAAEHGLEEARAALSQWQDNNARRVVDANDQRNRKKQAGLWETQKPAAPAAAPPAAGEPEAVGPAKVTEEMSLSG